MADIQTREEEILHKQHKLRRKDKIRLLIPIWLKNRLIELCTSNAAGKLISTFYSDSIPHRGLRLNTSCTQVLNTTKAALFFGIYERSEIEQAEAFYKSGFDIIELGASIGANTTRMLSYIENRRLIAVEADPELANALRGNVVLNFGDKHNCHVVNAAIDYSGKHAVAFRKGGCSLDGRISDEPDECENYTEVATTTLAGVINKYGIKSYILVIDIEGAEAAMIIEDRDSLKNCFRIISEIDGGTHKRVSYSIRDLIDILGTSGFKVVYRHANRIVFENTKFIGESGQVL